MHMLRMRAARAAAGASVLAIGLAGAAAPAHAADSGLDAYEVKADAATLAQLARQGYDVTEARSHGRIEIVATPGQAAKLRGKGLAPRLKRNSRGETAREFDARIQRSDGSYDVYRPYYDDTYVGTDGDGHKRQTLYQEYVALARERPDVVKLETIGESLGGKPIIALKITQGARGETDGSRPAVLYSANQHAREWITAEQDRRLVHWFVDHARSGEVQGILKDTELWFVPMANPDGYDFTFTPGNRLWRKNLRDNNGDGQITTGDGVDPNRNYPTAWNYDDEGSSSDPASETYRGSGPASEPETRALDGLLKRIRFVFQVNYHSAAELLLYPFGFQVETTTADDPIYRALSGDHFHPAIAGVPGSGAPDDYESEVAARLYTTNGETTDHAHTEYGTLAWTPEMDVADPARGGGDSVFEFQDSDADLQDAFDKNLPFALDLAKSAHDPANPVTHLGIDTPDFEPQSFSVSYGDPQTVEVNAKRELGAVRLHWEVEGSGDEHAATTQEWAGGERFGGPGDVYYHRLRGTVTGTRPGDRVKVWFEGRRGQATSAPFTYTVRSDTGNPVLIMAAEDYTGQTNAPAYPGTAGPYLLDRYQAALDAAGVGYDVYDVDAEHRTAPDRLGILSHYRAVIWYTGNDLLTRGPDQGPGTGVAKLVEDEILNVRAYLNEGGKLLYTGQNAAYSQVNGFSFNYAGEPPYCPPTGDSETCIPLSNDFLQYYLGAYQHLDLASSKQEASAVPLSLAGGPFGTGSFTLDGGDSADNQQHAYTMLTTSSVLPRGEYPLFTSDAAVKADRPSAFDPASGDYYAVARSNDASYQRLRRTIDLSSVSSSAALSFKLSFDTEPSYDFVFVEAHTVGQDDWTTLPDANGHSSTDVGLSCDINWDTLHPFLAHYQTNTDKSQDPGDEDCTGTGTTGSWNAATGNSGGYQDWSVDLSAYQGKQVEVSITYAQDFASAGLGVFLDDVSLTEDGATADQTSFEGGLEPFTAGPAPEGSENDQQWMRSRALGYVVGPGVATADTLDYGFGFEGITSAEQRATVMAAALRYLGVPG
jgi:hypothetical protein